MLAMVAKKVECWQWWRKKFNADNAGDGSEKSLMLAMVAKESVILAMVAPKVKWWQCRQWWRKKFECWRWWRKKSGFLAMLAKKFNAENAGASGERIFFGYNVPHPPTPI